MVKHPRPAIVSALIGMSLSTALPGCAHRPVEVAVDRDVPVAIPVTDPPPAELTACARRPDGLPDDPALLATIPAPVRAGIIRLATAFRLNADQLDRLIDWNRPDTCATPAK